MKFKYVGPRVLDEDGVEIAVNAYGGHKVNHGDVIELNDFFSEKAKTNENYKVHTVRRKKAHENNVSESSEVVNIDPDEDFPV